MKIIIEQKAGKDYPAELKGNEKFLKALEREVRKRLELRDIDIVEIREVE